jgi:hypothetical protein
MLRRIKQIVKRIIDQDIVFLIPNNFNNLTFRQLSNHYFFIRFGGVTHLCSIMKQAGSDKSLYLGNGKHNYTPLYHNLFKHLRRKEINLFELGIGTTNLTIEANMGEKGKPGASLRGWKNYFGNGKIFGADIDETILFEEKRIKTFYCDQTNLSKIKDLWNQLPQKFDIIIDDGLHEFDANVIFLENSIFKLAENGFYIIEDVKNALVHQWDDYLKDFCKKNSHFKYIIFKIPNRYNKIDNNIIMLLPEVKD